MEFKPVLEIVKLGGGLGLRKHLDRTKNPSLLPLDSHTVEEAKREVRTLMAGRYYPIPAITISDELDPPDADPAPVPDPEPPKAKRGRPVKRSKAAEAAPVAHDAPDTPDPDGGDGDADAKEETAPAILPVRVKRNK